jgi:hypothetical protein
MPQPNFVPVIPSSSRMTQSSGVSDSTSREYAFPFTVNAIMEPSLFPAWPGTHQLPALSVKSNTAGSPFTSQMLVPGEFFMGP